MRPAVLRPVALGLAAAAAVACNAVPAAAPLASARVASDMESYTIRRVGLLPPAGARLTPDQGRDLRSAFFAEFSATSDFEIVSLTETDLEAIPSMEPYRRGDYRPRTILSIARRYRVDALLIPTVTDLQSHPPQRLGLSVDLVSTETGQALWTSSVQLDAAQQRVRRGLEAWCRRQAGDVTDTTWELTLLSPRRFARFAAHQLAATL